MNENETRINQSIGSNPSPEEGFHYRNKNDINTKCSRDKIFSRNENYFDGPPISKHLKIRILAEALPRSAEFITGYLDIMEMNIILFRYVQMDGFLLKKRIFHIFGIFLSHFLWVLQH